MNCISMVLGFLGGWEIALIVLVVLLIFGGKKIPELMRGLGKGVKNFKEGMNENDSDEGKSNKSE
ncbi:MAG: twin-arginine translocase TatA/TatE family subunit [Bacteroidales bacterium]|nr:twin-arginine translocase TatA/TatE family subunit [Bacteroidales bacterium]